jgi:RimJ/RimL family protein N-acetyltransferase
MTNWVKYPVIIEGVNLWVIPLEKSHLSELSKLASDTRIWEFYPFDGSNENRFLEIYNNFIEEREKGMKYPFVIINKRNNKIIGSTSFLDIQMNHRKLEIGATWLHPNHWGTSSNLECKLIILNHCFSELLARRVQLKTDEKNIRSRKAIEKTGAQFEGILRNEMVRDNNTNRNSVFYSIIDSEWQNIKFKLIELLKNYENK